jgi:hypothetical protein
VTTRGKVKRILTPSPTTNVLGISATACQVTTTSLVILVYIGHAIATTPMIYVAVPPTASRTAMSPILRPLTIKPVVLNQSNLQAHRWFLPSFAVAYLASITLLGDECAVKGCCADSSFPHPLPPEPSQRSVSKPRPQLPRIQLPRTPVNKGKKEKKGRGYASNHLRHHGRLASRSSSSRRLARSRSSSALLRSRSR